MASRLQSRAERERKGNNLLIKGAKNLNVIKWYRKKIEVKLEENCREILKIIEQLIKRTKSGKDVESQVFFTKMIADYNRYMCEFVDGDKRDHYVQTASDQYEAALKMSESLNPCSPLRLGIELNMSVFQYEIKNDTKTAILIAHDSYDKIEKQLQTLQNAGDEYNDAATIMQLLYENLNMWNKELQEQQGTGDKNDY